MQRLVLAFSGVLALGACANEPTRAELEAECSPEFLLQYDMDALDTQYAPTVEAAAAYGIEDAELDLSAEANLCLDYKDQYEVQQQSYEAMSSQVEAEANARELAASLPAEVGAVVAEQRAALLDGADGVVPLSQVWGVLKALLLRCSPPRPFGYPSNPRA